MKLLAYMSLCANGAANYPTCSVTYVCMANPWSYGKTNTASTIYVDSENNTGPYFSVLDADIQSGKVILTPIAYSIREGWNQTQFNPDGGSSYYAWACSRSGGSGN